MKDNILPKLFTPFNLKNVELRNRIAVPTTARHTSLYKRLDLHHLKQALAAADHDKIVEYRIVTNEVVEKWCVYEREVKARTDKELQTNKHQE